GGPGHASRIGHRDGAGQGVFRLTRPIGLEARHSPPLTSVTPGFLHAFRAPVHPPAAACPLGGWGALVAETQRTVGPGSRAEALVRPTAGRPPLAGQASRPARRSSHRRGVLLV